ncbi:CPBP family intramembrane glutamic endopeptidase [Marinactinospora rubrisoli]|uniref:CPBP family intramembrane glutamic endopeptidase n=1 Tax=Marinactinospora rubrisoli TaxID=2715399 RepID=A0ABW2KMT7_9ACTN
MATPRQHRTAARVPPAATPPRRERVAELVRRHPLACYLFLCFTLTWLAWTPYVLSDNGMGLLSFGFPEVLGSPQTLGMLPGAYLGPLFSAYLVITIAEGEPGLRTWARRLFRWRIGWCWFLLILLGVPAAQVLGTFFLPQAWETVQLPSISALLVYLPFLAVQVAFTGVAEEPGWRDFALPRLQHRHGPLAGTLILGLLWGAWHLPLFLTEWAGWPHVDPVQIIEFLVTSVVIGIPMTWVFNRTGESLPAVMLLHAGINNATSVLWLPMFPELDVHRDAQHALLITSAVISIALIAATRGRLGYQPPTNRHV